MIPARVLGGSNVSDKNATYDHLIIANENELIDIGAEEVRPEYLVFNHGFG